MTENIKNLLYLTEKLKKVGPFDLTCKTDEEADIILSSLKALIKTEPEFQDPANWQVTKEDMEAGLRAAQALAQPERMLLFWNSHSEWSNQVFGSITERGPMGLLKHLRKEVEEVIDNPGDLMEYADCMTLVMDATRRAGFTFDQLVEAMFAKLEINRAREWPKAGPNEPVEHVRPGWIRAVDPRTGEVGATILPQAAAPEASNAEPSAPETAHSTHTPTEPQNTADTSASAGQTPDTAGTPAAANAIAPSKPRPELRKKPSSKKRAQVARLIRNGAPHATPPTTPETGKA